MQTGLHAIGWGLPRLAIAVAVTVFAIFFAYTTWVFVIVAVQALNGLSH